jgi:nicotinamidase-related amidase
MRVWDKFLTEQDKEHNRRVGKKELFGFGEKPAILAIDLYYSVVGLVREPILESIKTWPGSCGEAGWESVDKTVELLAAARENNIPIIYCHGMEDFAVPWNRKGGKTNPLAHLPAEVRAKANEIIAEVAPQPGDTVLKKTAASIFQGTPIEFKLNYLGIDTLIVCGETTSGCVRASVVDGHAYRYSIGVVEECCFDRTEASHAINLFDMHQKYADVVSLEYAKEYLAKVGASKKVLTGV